MSVSPLEQSIRSFLKVEGTGGAVQAEGRYRAACEQLTRTLATHPPHHLSLPENFWTSLPRKGLCWAWLGWGIAAMQLGFHLASHRACRNALQVAGPGRLPLLFSASADNHRAWWHCRVGEYSPARLACSEVLESVRDADGRRLPAAAAHRLAAEASFVLGYTAYRQRRVWEARGYAREVRAHARRAWPQENEPLEKLLLTSGLNLPLLEHQIAVFESCWDVTEAALREAVQASESAPHLLHKVLAKDARALLYRHRIEPAGQSCQAILHHAGPAEPEARLDALHYLARIALNNSVAGDPPAASAQLKQAEHHLQEGERILSRQMGNPREKMVFALLRAEWAGRRAMLHVRPPPGSERGSLETAERRRDEDLDASLKALDTAHTWQTSLPEDETLHYKLHLVQARVARVRGQWRDADRAYRQAIAVERLRPPSRLLARMLAEYARFVETDLHESADLCWAEACDLVRHDPADPLWTELEQRLGHWPLEQWLAVVRESTRGGVRARVYVDRTLATAAEATQGLLTGLEHDLNHECNLIRDLLPQPGRPAANSGEAIRAAQARVRGLGRQFVRLFQDWELSGGESPVEEELNGLLEGVVSRFSVQGNHLLDRPIQLLIREPLPPVRIHPAWFELALGNLVRNALQQYEQPIPTDQRREIRITAAREGGGVRLRVWNAGSRIEPDVLTHLFQLGKTGRRKRGGSGKGLYFARLAVALCDGWLCGGNVDGGVAFHISVPAPSDDR